MALSMAAGMQDLQPARLAAARQHVQALSAQDREALLRVLVEQYEHPATPQEPPKPPTPQQGRHPRPRRIDIPSSTAIASPSPAALASFSVHSSHCGRRKGCPAPTLATRSIPSAASLSKALLPKVSSSKAPMISQVNNKNGDFDSGCGKNTGSSPPTTFVSRLRSHSLSQPLLHSLSRSASRLRPSHNRTLSLPASEPLSPVIDCPSPITGTSISGAATVATTPAITPPVASAATAPVSKAASTTNAASAAAVSTSHTGSPSRSPSLSVSLSSTPLANANAAAVSNTASSSAHTSAHSSARISTQSSAPSSPQFSTRAYWCTLCGEKFLHRADWDRHDNTCWRQHQKQGRPHSNQEGSLQRNSHNSDVSLHHSQQQQQQRAWACGFCAAFLGSLERYQDHVALHFEGGKTLAHWHYANVIYGLLHQPIVHHAWKQLWAARVAALPPHRRPKVSWAPGEHSDGDGGGNGPGNSDNSGHSDGCHGTGDAIIYDSTNANRFASHARLQESLEYFNPFLESAEELAARADALAIYVTVPIEDNPYATAGPPPCFIAQPTTFLLPSASAAGANGSPPSARQAAAQNPIKGMGLLSNRTPERTLPTDPYPDGESTCIPSVSNVSPRGRSLATQPQKRSGGRSVSSAQPPPLFATNNHACHQAASPLTHGLRAPPGHHGRPEANASQAAAGPAPQSPHLSVRQHGTVMDSPTEWNSIATTVVEDMATAASPMQPHTPQNI